MRRGQVWWVRFPPPMGQRPAVLLSRDQAYQVREAATVVPLTRTVRQLPVEVPLGPEDGIPRRSAANADSITTVAKSEVLDYLTTLSSEKMQALEKAVRFALNLR